MEITPQFVILVPVVMALTSLVKMYIPLRYVPVSAVALGVALSFAILPKDFATALMQGILVGCTAAGVYSGTKTTITA